MYELLNDIDDYEYTSDRKTFLGVIMVYEKKTFGAEVDKTLYIMIHSLYTNKEIFMRQMHRITTSLSAVVFIVPLLLYLGYLFLFLNFHYLCLRVVKALSRDLLLQQFR